MTVLDFYQSKDSRPVEIDWNKCSRSSSARHLLIFWVPFRISEEKNLVRLLTNDVCKTNVLLTFFSVWYSFLWAVSILSTKKGAVDKQGGSWFFNTQHVWLGNNTPKQPSTYQPSRWKAGTGKSTLVFLDKTYTFKQNHIDWGVYSTLRDFILFNELMNEYISSFY